MKKALPFLFLATLAIAQPPLFRIVDLDVGATEQVHLPNGASATVKLVSTSETRDKVRSATRAWKPRSTARAPRSPAATIVCRSPSPACKWIALSPKLTIATPIAITGLW
jgi:hypothetical protein